MSAAHPAGPTPLGAWPAMVLTAGLGTRLQPLSAVRAKPALPVAGLPLAGRILRWLGAAGVPAAVLNLHHRPETITAAIGDGTAFGVPVRYSWEPDILGSAGGPARALPMLDADRFLLVNGDTLTNLDLAALVAQHVATGARVTMALIANPDPLHYGGVSVDGDGRITGFPLRGPDNRGWHFIGVQAVDRSVFTPLDPDRPSATVGQVYRDLMASDPNAVRAFLSGATFQDIGTAADYLDTCLALASAENDPACLRGARVAVEPDARIARSILWDDVTVGPGCALDECVVADGVTIPAGARYVRRAIVHGADLAAGPDDERIGPLLVSPLDARRRGPSR
ncbi:MAG: NDP-sugar synthase [Acidobacteria bacterium]|nr:NDP-sugar synthase [Acidobacteriota bacterium]